MMWKAMTGELLFERFHENIMIEHMTDDLAKAERVFDFLPKMRMISPSEEKILYKWVDFFRLKKVPFVVICEIPGVWVLWKAEEISEKERIAAYGKTWRDNHRKEK